LVIAASAAASVTNLAVKSERDVAASQLDITDQTPPPKPKCESLKILLNVMVKNMLRKISVVVYCVI